MIRKPCRPTARALLDATKPRTILVARGIRPASVAERSSRRFAAAVAVAAAASPGVAAAKVVTTVAGATSQAPASYTMPAWKATAADPAFGGTITGMTSQAGCTLHYQSIQEVDAGGTQVLWDKGCNPTVVSDLAGNVLHSSLPSGDRRWDPAHPGDLLVFTTTAVQRYVLATGILTNVCTLPAAYTFPDTSWPLGGTADVSDNGAKVAVTPKRVSDGQPVMFVWDLTTCAKSIDVPLGADWAPGYAEISHGGGAVFVYKGCAVAGAYPACDYGKVYSTATMALMQDWSGLKHCPGHADWVLTATDATIVGMCKDGALAGHFVARGYGNGVLTDLTQGLKIAGTHASGRGSTARPGWAAVTLSPDSALANSSGYAHPWGECDFLAVDGSGALERIVQTHTAIVSSDTEARCTSRDGQAVFFDSNGGGASSATNHGYKGQ